MVAIPRPAGLEVARVELPALVRPVEPRLQPLLLLLARDVQPHLDHGRALLDQQPLPVHDVAHAAPRVLGVDDAEHLRGDDVLVVRAVEDPDLATARGHAVQPPEVVAVQLVAARCLEALDPDALRVDPGRQLADRAVLARGVHALQDQQQRLPVLGPEAFLEVADLLDQLVLVLLALVLVVETEVVAGVADGEARLLARVHPEVLDHGLLPCGR